MGLAALGRAALGRPRPGLELRMLTGVDGEPAAAADGLSRRAIDERAVDAFEAALRRPPRRAEDPPVELGLARLTRREEPGGVAHIGVLHWLNGMRAGSCVGTALGHRRRPDRIGVGEDGKDHAHRGADALLAEELHRPAVAGDDRADEGEAHARTGDGAHPRAAGEFVPHLVLLPQRDAAAGVGDLDDDPPMVVDDLLVRAEFDDFGLRGVLECIAEQIEDRGEEEILLTGDVGQAPGSTRDRRHDHPILGARCGRGVLDGLMDEAVEVDAGVLDDAGLDIGEFAQVGEQTRDPAGGDVDLLGRGLHLGERAALSGHLTDRRRRRPQGGERILQLVVEADEHPVALGERILGSRGLDRLAQRGLAALETPPAEERGRRESCEDEEEDEEEQPDLDLDDQEVRHIRRSPSSPWTSPTKR